MGYDIKKLRNDLEEEGMGAYFGGGFGGGLMEALDAENASDEELIRMAEKQGIDLNKYRR